MSDFTGMDPGFTSQLERLIAASGGQISIASGFRSQERQTQLFNEAVKKYGSPEKASRYVAPPGHSNHEKGVAADLQFNTPQARQLAHQLAPQFGLLFPMNYEPWHIEPVGARDKASPQAYGLPTNGYLHPQDPNYLAANPQAVAAQLSDAIQKYGGGGTQTLLEGGLPNDPGAGAQPTSTTETVSSPNPQGGAGGDTVSRFLASVKKHESGGNYQAKNPHATASGAYQVINSTWNNFGGYATAASAPPEVQDAFARQKVEGMIASGVNDPHEWAAVWYVGHVPKANEWNTEPNKGLSINSYANWIQNDMNTGGATTRSGAR